jgi:hypothetical protein
MDGKEKEKKVSGRKCRAKKWKKIKKRSRKKERR